MTEEDLEALSRTQVREAGGQDERTVTLTVDQLNTLRRGEAPEEEEVSRDNLDEFLKAEGVALVVDIGAGRGDDGLLLVGGRYDSRGDRSLEGVLNSFLCLLASLTSARGRPDLWEPGPGNQ